MIKLFTKKKERVFNVKLFLTGFMGNKWLFGEFEEAIDDWQIKHNGVEGYIWFKKVSLHHRWKYKFNDFTIEVTELI